MELAMFNSGTLDRAFQDRPEILEELAKHRVVEAYEEAADYAMRVIPGNRRDLLALPGCDIMGSADEVYYIDLKADGDDGALYLGAKLFAYLTRLVGYCEVEELRRATERVRELEKQVDHLSKQLGRVRVVTNGLVDLESAETGGVPVTSGRGTAKAASHSG